MVKPKHSASPQIPHANCEPWWWISDDLLIMFSGVNKKRNKFQHLVIISKKLTKMSKPEKKTYCMYAL